MSNRKWWSEGLSRVMDRSPTTTLEIIFSKFKNETILTITLRETEVLHFFKVKGECSITVLKWPLQCNELLERSTNCYPRSTYIATDCIPFVSTPIRSTEETKLLLFQSRWAQTNFLKRKWQFLLAKLQIAEHTQSLQNGLSVYPCITLLKHRSPSQS